MSRVARRPRPRLTKKVERNIKMLWHWGSVSDYISRPTVWLRDEAERLNGEAEGLLRVVEQLEEWYSPRLAEELEHGFSKFLSSALDSVDLMREYLGRVRKMLCRYVFNTAEDCDPSALSPWFQSVEELIEELGGVVKRYATEAADRGRAVRDVHAVVSRLREAVRNLFEDLDRRIYIADPGRF